MYIGLVDVCYFSGWLVEPLSYKYPLPLFTIHALSGRQFAKIPLMSVFYEFFVAIGEEVLEVSLQGGNITKPNLFLRRYTA
jgi:hypothetical protein